MIPALRMNLGLGPPMADAQKGSFLLKLFSPQKQIHMVQSLRRGLQSIFSSIVYEPGHKPQKDVLQGSAPI